MAKKKWPKCSWCGERCEDGPMRGKGADAICYDCWRDHCTFDCCQCCEIEDDEHQDEIGCLLVVKDKMAGVTVGLYEIVDHPYYGGPIIGSGYLFPESLKRIGRSPAGCDTGQFPVGHLCRECTHKARKRVT